MMTNGDQRGGFFYPTLKLMVDSNIPGHNYILLRIYMRVCLSASQSSLEVCFHMTNDGKSRVQSIFNFRVRFMGYSKHIRINFNLRRY